MEFPWQYIGFYSRLHPLMNNGISVGIWLGQSLDIPNMDYLVRVAAKKLSHVFANSEDSAAKKQSLA